MPARLRCGSSPACRLSAVLCIQGATDLNFAEHPGCVGLGYTMGFFGLAQQFGSRHSVLQCGYR